MVLGSNLFTYDIHQVRIRGPDRTYVRLLGLLQPGFIEIRKPLCLLG